MLIFVPKQLQSAREKAGLTRAQVATLAKLTEDAIWRIETARREPKVNTLAAIADSIGCPMDNLFRKESRETSSKKRSS